MSSRGGASPCSGSIQFTKGAKERQQRQLFESRKTTLSHKNENILCSYYTANTTRFLHPPYTAFVSLPGICLLDCEKCTHSLILQSKRTLFHTLSLGCGVFSIRLLCLDPIEEKRTLLLEKTLWWYKLELMPKRTTAVLGCQYCASQVRIIAGVRPEDERALASE